MKPALFHIDVSTEVAEFISLLGIPFTYVRQSGERNDPAHERIYQMAQSLVAPYPEWMEDSSHVQYKNKTHYHPIFNEKSSCPPLESEEILYMRSSTEDDPQILHRLKVALEKVSELFQLTLIGTPIQGLSGPNIRQIGWTQNLDAYIAQSKCVLSSCGNNSILELMNVEKPLILIPERKAFKEQLSKARRLFEAAAIPFISFEEEKNQDLINLINEAKTQRCEPIRNEAKEFARAITRCLGL